MPSPRDLLQRTHQFGLRIMRFYRRLPKTPEAQKPGQQLLDAGLSVALNYRAARKGRSRKEFIAKLGICVEESDECVGWLEVLRDSGIAFDDRLMAEAKEISAIMTAAQKTARRNLHRGI
jgi:four helix bundle protein